MKNTLMGLTILTILLPVSSYAHEGVSTAFMASMLHLFTEPEHLIVIVAAIGITYLVRGENSVLQRMFSRKK